MVVWYTTILYTLQCYNIRIVCLSHKSVCFYDTAYCILLHTTAYYCILPPDCISVYRSYVRVHTVRVCTYRYVYIDGKVIPGVTRCYQVLPGITKYYQRPDEEEPPPQTSAYWAPPCVRGALSGESKERSDVIYSVRQGHVMDTSWTRHGHVMDTHGRPPKKKEQTRE